MGAGHDLTMGHARRADLRRADFRRAWQDADPTPFWLDSSDRPAARESLRGLVNCDLVVIGGGFSGLWTALLAKQRDPGRRVVLVEAGRIAGAATGRNGGFCAASLTHGEANGRDRFGAEYDTLHRLGLDNVDGIERTITEFGIDCAWERTGELDVATEPYQVDDLRTGASELLRGEGLLVALDHLPARSAGAL